MAESGQHEVTLPDPPSDRPRVVEEADEVLTVFGWQLGGTGAAAGLVWGGAAWMGTPLPLAWLGVVLVALVLLYFSPVTREPKLAREVLRRWDELRVQRALETSGASSDPRLEVAESMAYRILQHPAVGANVRQTTEALVRQLRLVLADLRRVEWLGQTNAMDQSRRGRPISDLQDVLDARAAGIVAQLAELHRTVVLRDADATRRVMGTVQALLAELEAEEEVERFLADTEERG